MQRISSVKTASYEPAVMRDAVRRHLAALDADTLLHPGARVLLKPNLLLRRAPERGTTTHPALVEAVALCLRERGVEEITIADSPGGPYTRAALEGIYEVCGMARAAENSGARLNLSTGSKTVDNPRENGLCASFNLIDPVTEADVVINLPKLKTHAMATLSGGVKNLLGCVPGLQKPELHFRFPQHGRFGRMLVELAATVRPQLTIVDAVVSMEGDGPSSGVLRQTGWTFAARDVFALDLALCHIIGLDPAEVPTVAFAREAGMGPASLEELDFPGDGMPADIAPFARPRSREADFSTALPGPFGKLVRAAGRLLLVSRPAVSAGDCTGCGRCAESCPADTIEMRANKAHIRYKGCIKCYCCHEMCPVGAVGIRRGGLLKL